MVGWVAITPPGANAVTALALDSASALYVATDAGMFRTEGGRISWTALGALEGRRQVLAFAFDPVMPSTLYISTANYGVFRSRDGGRTWQWASAGLPGGYSGYALAVHLKLSGTIYVGTDGGVFKTVNEGEHWTPMNRGLTPYSDRVTGLAIDVSSPETVYAAIDRLYKSTNGGSDWEPLAGSGIKPEQLSGVYAVALDPQDPATIYAGTTTRITLESSGAGFGVFRSDDAGATWTHLRSGMPPFLAAYSFAFIPSAGIVCAGTSSGLFQIPRAGTTWSPVAGGLLKGPSLVFDEESDTLYAGGSGLFKLASVSRLKPATRVSRTEPFRPPS
jgi:photosystem II stability/assembly factor-like uncharacterized protein